MLILERTGSDGRCRWSHLWLMCKGLLWRTFRGHYSCPAIAKAVATELPVQRCNEILELTKGRSSCRSKTCKRAFHRECKRNYLKTLQTLFSAKIEDKNIIGKYITMQVTYSSIGIYADIIVFTRVFTFLHAIHRKHALWKTPASDIFSSALKLFYFFKAAGNYLVNSFGANDAFGSSAEYKWHSKK